jgi:hypothetical protein
VLLIGDGTDTFTVDIADAIGPATTPGDILAEQTGTFPTAGLGSAGILVDVPFTLSLPAGHYYILVSSDNTDSLAGGWKITALAQSSEVGSAGGTFASCCVDGAHNNEASPLGSTFIPGSAPYMEFQLEGTAPDVTAPEPSSFTLTATCGIAVLAALAWRRRRGVVG